MKLTDIACKSAKPESKSYKLADGGDLYLEVTSKDSKLWRLKYRFLGKEKKLFIGEYPIITLADARETREKAKKLLKSGLDPSAEKQSEKQEAIRNAQNTFKALALEWHETFKHKWTESHANTVLRRLEMDVFPEMFYAHHGDKALSPH